MYRVRERYPENNSQDIFFILTDQSSCSQHATVAVPSPYQNVPLSPTMPPQTPTCHSNTVFSTFNGHACLSSLPHGAMVPTQYHMTPYCSATETYGTFSHAFHSGVSPFSACAANGVVNQSDNSFIHQGNGFQGNAYATTHAFTTHTV